MVIPNLLYPGETGNSKDPSPGKTPINGSSTLEQISIALIAEA